MLAGFELLAREPKQRRQEVGCFAIIGLLACCGGAVAVSTHQAGAALKPACDIAVVGTPFERARFEAVAQQRGVLFTYMRAKGGRDSDLAWAEKRTLLYPKLCVVTVTDGITRSVRFETYTPP